MCSANLSKSTATLKNNLATNIANLNYFFASKLIIFRNPYINILEDVCKNLFLGDSECGVIVVGVRATVNYSVHIQVQVVELRNLNYDA